LPSGAVANADSNRTKSEPTLISVFKVRWHAAKLLRESGASIRQTDIAEATQVLCQLGFETRHNTIQLIGSALRQLIADSGDDLPTQGQLVGHSGGLLFQLTANSWPVGVQVIVPGRGLQ